MDSEETDGDSMIVSSSTMLTEVRLLIVYIIVDVNVILVMNFFPTGLRAADANRF